MVFHSVSCLNTPRINRDGTQDEQHVNTDVQKQRNAVASSSNVSSHPTQDHNDPYDDDHENLTLDYDQLDLDRSDSDSVPEKMDEGLKEFYPAPGSEPDYVNYECCDLFGKGRRTSCAGEGGVAVEPLQGYFGILTYLKEFFV